jgi:hypothetical protein
VLQYGSIAYVQVPIVGAGNGKAVGHVAEPCLN